MRFVGFPQRVERSRLRILIGLSIAGLPLAAALAGGVTVEPSFIYCLDHDGAKIFAGREKRDGSLTFGISVWSPAGQNISVFGTAKRHGTGWQYIENIQARTAAERCRLEIFHSADGSLRVKADPNATCRSHGGVNAEIGTVQFPHTAYEGTVTTELDDPEAFQKAGKCVGIKD